MTSTDIPTRTSDAPDRISLFIGVPCTQTGITESFLHSALALPRHCTELGWNLRIATRSDGLVTRTRNIFGSRMVKCDDFTHLLMVDADIGFEPCVVERFVRSGHDFVGACVPLREMQWETVHEAIQKRADLSSEQMRSISHGHAVSFPHKEKEGDGGLFRVGEFCLSEGHE